MEGKSDGLKQWFRGIIGRSLAKIDTRQLEKEIDDDIRAKFFEGKEEHAPKNLATHEDIILPFTAFRQSLFIGWLIGIEQDSPIVEQIDICLGCSSI